MAVTVTATAKTGTDDVEVTVVYQQGCHDVRIFKTYWGVSRKTKYNLPFKYKLDAFLENPICNKVVQRELHVST